jgi:hypothetical protein
MGAVVEHLAGVLAQQRLAEDVIGARHLLGPVLAELDLVGGGARDGRKVSAGVLALVTQQQARGHALEGNSRDVDELLDLTEDLTAASADQPEDESPWVYFTSPERVLFQRGVAYVELGRHAEAV